MTTHFEILSPSNSQSAGDLPNSDEECLMSRVQVVSESLLSIPQTE